MFHDVGFYRKILMVNDSPKVKKIFTSFPKKI